MYTMANKKSTASAKSGMNMKHNGVRIQKLSDEVNRKKPSLLI